MIDADGDDQRGGEAEHGGKVDADLKRGDEAEQDNDGCGGEEGGERGIAERVVVLQPMHVDAVNVRGKVGRGKASNGFWWYSFGLVGEGFKFQVFSFQPESS